MPSTKSNDIWILFKDDVFKVLDLYYYNDNWLKIEVISWTSTWKIWFISKNKVKLLCVDNTNLGLIKSSCSDGINIFWNASWINSSQNTSVDSSSNQSTETPLTDNTITTEEQEFLDIFWDIFK